MRLKERENRAHNALLLLIRLLRQIKA